MRFRVTALTVRGTVSSCDNAPHVIPKPFLVVVLPHRLEQLAWKEITGRKYDDCYSLWYLTERR